LPLFKIEDIGVNNIRTEEKLYKECTGPTAPRKIVHIVTYLERYPVVMKIHKVNG
jgi:hypothetical protein